MEVEVVLAIGENCPHKSLWRNCYSTLFLITDCRSKPNVGPLVVFNKQGIVFSHKKKLKIVVIYVTIQMKVTNILRERRAIIL